MDGAKGIFVTGTDTGVGKTLVSCALLELLRGEGLRVAGFKPVSCGREDGCFADAEALRAAAGGTQPLDAVSPLRFDAALAPTLAARAEGRRVDLSSVRAALAHAKAGADAVVVEGVGGWLVPLDENTLAADFAAELGWPVLVVARAGLGTINHTLLTLRDLRGMNVPLAGVVLSDAPGGGSGLPQPGASDEIERIAQVKILASLPRLETRGTAAVKQAAERIGRALHARAIQASALLG